MLNLCHESGIGSLFFVGYIEQKVVYEMALAMILAILLGTLIGWFFIDPYNYQELCRYSDADDKD
jgi:hypothetical protein